MQCRGSAHRRSSSIQNAMPLTKQPISPRSERMRGGSISSWPGNCTRHTSEIGAPSSQGWRLEELIDGNPVQLTGKAGGTAVVSSLAPFFYPFPDLPDDRARPAQPLRPPCSCQGLPHVYRQGNTCRSVADCADCVRQSTLSESSTGRPCSAQALVSDALLIVGVGNARACSPGIWIGGRAPGLHEAGMRHEREEGHRHFCGSPTMSAPRRTHRIGQRALDAARPGNVRSAS